MAVAATSDRSACAELAEDAVIWGFPLMMAGLYLDAAVQNGVQYNVFQLSEDIASAKSSGVGSNIDTLNGLAWLDLSSGPQVISVPDMADRYYTIQLQDMYMNSFAYIGRRTTGTAAGSFAVTPPGFEGKIPANLTEIRAPTTRVFAFLRTLVRGDIEEVRGLNRSVTVGPLTQFPSGQREGQMRDGALAPFQPRSRLEGGKLPHQEIAGLGASYFKELDKLVSEYPPHDWDEQNLARFAPLGIGSSVPADSGPCSEQELAAASEAGVALAVRSVKAWPENGWLRRRNVEEIVMDPLERAANTVYGPGTQIAKESIFYNLRLGLDGKPLSGANRYRLRFAPGQLPPVDAFWSVTLYDGNYFIFDNPLDRYGITDRTDGLRFGDDGSLEILIQAEEPDGGDANWLPAPQGAFQLVFRTYQPREELLDGSYRLPPLEIVEP